MENLKEYIEKLDNEPVVLVSKSRVVAELKNVLEEIEKCQKRKADLSATSATMLNPAN